MKRNLLPSLLGSSLLMFGCPATDDPSDTAAVEDDDGEDEGEEDGETENETLPMESMTTAQPTTTDDPTDTDEPTTTDDPTSGPSFLEEPDGGGVAIECDVWEDDCPDGEKCMPWANDGGSSWNATKCSPVQPDAGEIGDECTVEGSGVSGVDSCTNRSMCYYVDPETNMGICIGFCSGTPMNPTCDDPDDICTIVNDGVLTLCRPRCDPTLQDCDGNASCLQATGNLGFTCIIDASAEDAMPGDPCEFINSCPIGTMCAAAEGVPGCAGTGCCTHWCDLDDPDPDSACTLGGGQVCTAWFEEGEAPPGLEHVGICFIPTG